MRSKERSKEFFIAGVATSLFALSACSGGSETASVSPPATDTQPTTLSGLLESFNILGPNKDGAKDAVNTGETAAVYDRATSQTVGEIVAGQAFAIVCLEDPKPVSLRVMTEAYASGDVNLGGAALQQFNDGELQEVPRCEINPMGAPASQRV